MTPDNPVQKWFYKTVGGPDRMIPKEHGLPLILRIHHRQITAACGVEEKMGRRAASILRGIDSFYNYRAGIHRFGLGYHYPRGNSSTEDANPAEFFWNTTALKPEVVTEFRGMFNKSIQEGWGSKLQEAREKSKSRVGRLVVTAVESWLKSNLARETADRVLVTEADQKFLGHK